MKPTKILKELLQKDDVLISIGAYDALSAKIIEQAGFQAVFTSGFGISASFLGKPDAELYTMTENLTMVRNIAQTVSIPVIADLDTGYGNAVNVIRTIKEFERAGCAGGFIEDQMAPKRCPACVEGFDLVPIEEAVGKIKAAVDAREDSDFLIIGRTDAGGQEAVDRANAYLEAGAGLAIFISRAFSSFAEMKKYSRQVEGPFSISFFEGIKYPAWFKDKWTIDDLKAIGVKVLNFPLIPLFAATHAVQEVAKYIFQNKTIEGLESSKRIDHEEFIKVIGFPQVTELQMKYMPSPEVVFVKKG
jgi:2-methylisocitrate lyase-like PEP mutase family enzyme